MNIEISACPVCGQGKTIRLVTDEHGSQSAQVKCPNGCEAAKTIKIPAGEGVNLIVRSRAEGARSDASTDPGGV